MDLHFDREDIAHKLTAAGLPGSMLEEATDQVLGMLQMSVAMRLEEQLTDEQLLDFQRHADGGDRAATAAWLFKQFPEYDAIVAEELQTLIAELKQGFTELRG